VVPDFWPVRRKEKPVTWSTKMDATYQRVATLASYEEKNILMSVRLIILYSLSTKMDATHQRVATLVQVTRK
jgi:hypothetical protein